MKRIHQKIRKKPVGVQPICSEREVRLIDPVWVFDTVPSGFWQQPENRRNYLLWLGYKLRFRRMRDWYRLTYQDLASHHGAGVTSVWWQSSPVEAVKKCFPDYDWEEWKFGQVPKTFWSIAKNRRRYMAWLGQQLGFRRPTDWYRATTADFQRHRGGSLLLEYRSSVSETVIACFPKHHWKEWMFNRLPTGFWDDRRNCRRYMQWLGKRLGYRRLDDWYRIKGSDFKRNYGGELIKQYRSSASAMVVDLIPRSAWCEWMFTRVPPGFWDCLENRRRYVRWLGKRLGYRSMEDWAKVCRRDFGKHCGGSLMGRYRSCWDLLTECFPQWDWRSCRPPRTTIRQILDWADAHYAAHGQWPIAKTAAPIADTGLTWNRIEVALRLGSMGLAGGTSLARVLEKHRGKWVAKRAYYPRLTERQIITWQKKYRKAMGKWPTKSSGPVVEAPEESWFAISRALQRGNRGLPGGSGLAELRRKFGL